MPILTTVTEPSQLDNILTLGLVALLECELLEVLAQIICKLTLVKLAYNDVLVAL